MNKWYLRLNDLFNIKDFENEEIISQFVEVIKFCDQSGDKELQKLPYLQYEDIGILYSQTCRKYGTLSIYLLINTVNKNRLIVSIV